ncbi:hypothetical protein QBC39DRAFT_396776 [Podospora conica]|nr:hypothetical protein QBC39DRAFT_396776 [Schizothecium conicum]
MISSPWLAAAVGLTSLTGTAAQFMPHIGTTGYAKPRAVDVCPKRCAEVGVNTINWEVFPNLQMTRCPQTVFLDFSLWDLVDDVARNHRIQACSSFGADFYQTPSQKPIPGSLPIRSTRPPGPANSTNVEFEVGWWHEEFGLARGGIQSLVRQMREYIGHVNDTGDASFILYGHSGQASIGVFIGQHLQTDSIAESALRIFEDNFDKLNVTTQSLAMQLCSPGDASPRIFGVAVSSNGTFGVVQNAVQSWANATCLSFPVTGAEANTRKFVGTATFTTPPPAMLNGTSPGRWTNSTGSLAKRADCRTVQVASGEGCAELAAKCSITGAKFTEINSGANFCSTLQPKQYVCCTTGTLPDMRPKPNADGTCHSYQTVPDDNCSNLAAQYGLSIEDIEGFNKKTWGFSGCHPLMKDVVVCLSTGTPPFPVPLPNAICGPQKPGSTPPASGDLSTMNPCPLNACCNIWGQCGLTADFCVDTNTGPPGTAKAGTYGCISNCGLDIVKGTGTGAIKLAYFQGYGLSRPCLYQDALQIDTSKYTHLHFGFGTLTPDTYEVGVGDTLAQYQFEQFKLVRNAKRILSFGGWSFSTEPATYKIFREGVKPANRIRMATSIADYIKKHELDGVDIDWEYPGAPDLPDFDPGTAEDGPNYLGFLAVLKSLLPGKTVAIAAPASYWYLKQFPIKQIGQVVDYIVYMTYDLHGQWDAGSKWSQEGCEGGNCLRSQVNLTETKQGLALITKAGVPGSKVVVGVTSYGRSFNMAQAGCWGPGCAYTGTRLESHATPGRCTGTGGYLADAEIAEIISGGTHAKRDSGRVVTKFLDTSSNSDILVYDNTQWVAYMSESTKRVRTQLYASLGFAGTTDWASDLQTWNDPPRPANSWNSFITLAASGNNPKEDTKTTFGTWKSYDCQHVAISGWQGEGGANGGQMTQAERWKALDTDNAWKEVIHKWTLTDKPNRWMNFSDSVELTLKMGTSTNCHSFAAYGENKDNCDGTMVCDKGADGPFSGPAAQLIWNSLQAIHEVHHSYFRSLLAVKSSFALGAPDMQNTFAPIPEPKTNQWLNILLDLLTMGTLTAVAPVFNRFIGGAALTDNPHKFDNAKDFTLNMIGQSTTLAKDALQSPEGGKWTPAAQDRFTQYLGIAIDTWRSSTEKAVARLFDGEPEGIRLLTNAIANGKLIDGYRGRLPTIDPLDPVEREGEAIASEEAILKSIYAFSIPALWRASDTYAFILDSGADCSSRNAASKYISDDTASKTGVCVEGRQYYLVHTDGDARVCKCERVTDLGPCQSRCSDNTFSMPAGVGELGGKLWAGLTRDEIVTGAVRTWKYTGKNGADINPQSVAQNAYSNSDKADIATPGVVRLPVCSSDRAFQSWKTSDKGSTPNFPCDIPQGKSHCGISDFTDQTSGASPIVSDCQQIIRNIEGDGSTDWTHRITGHREILSHGSCHFGIERTGGTGGAVEFRVGGQDAIDVINDAIRRWGGGGRVGGKGVMPCSGTTAGTKVNVLWGIY